MRRLTLGLKEAARIDEVMPVVKVMHADDVELDAIELRYGFPFRTWL